MPQDWQKQWEELVDGRRRGLAAAGLRGLLWAMSGPYALAVRARNWLYDRGWRPRHVAAVPVVSVGNLSVGGTGKTPWVEYIARYYRQRDIRVCIVSRGYGSMDGRNDEAMLLEENLPDVPHLQDADRVAAAERAVAELETELIVLDDGFQHRRLHRDLDIVLLDASGPPTRDYLLPRGRLREPLGSLRRADLAVLTRCDAEHATQTEELTAALRRRFPKLSVVRSVHRPVEWRRGTETLPAAAAAGRKVAAFCGIGRPAAFRQTLQQLGAEVVAVREFPDHHAYSRRDVEELQRWAARVMPPDGWVVTTQKDAVKLRLTELGGRPLWVLRVAIEVVAGAELLHAALDRVAESVVRPAAEPADTTHAPDAADAPGAPASADAADATGTADVADTADAAES